MESPDGEQILQKWFSLENPQLELMLLLEGAVNLILKCSLAFLDTMYFFFFMLSLAHKDSSRVSIS